MTDITNTNAVEIPADAWPHVLLVLSVIDRIGFGGEIDPNRLSQQEDEEYEALAEMARISVSEIRRLMATQ